uniref:Uncharacterized protein n=1 Tax=Podoviridae sp. ctIKM86 TaxID=2827729 RepID=A0A8S5SNK6_9CAUD|nr:MAG TPA: hypothetical protein [Podoviridae sp. ctIKM86]
MAETNLYYLGVFDISFHKKGEEKIHTHVLNNVFIGKQTLNEPTLVTARAQMAKRFLQVFEGAEILDIAIMNIVPLGLMTPDEWSPKEFQEKMKEDSKKEEPKE